MRRGALSVALAALVFGGLVVIAPGQARITAADAAATCAPINGAGAPSDNNSSGNGQSAGVTDSPLGLAHEWDGMHISGYSISGAAGVATATLNTDGPAGPPPHYAGLLMVQWKTSAAIHWVGAIINDSTTAAAAPQYVGVSGTNDGSSTWTRDTPSAVKVSVTGKRIVLTFPYGGHAQAAMTISASNALTYAAGSGMATPTPVIPDGYPLVEGATLWKLSGAPGESVGTHLQGPGGAPFCGTGNVGATDSPCPTSAGTPQASPTPGQVTCLADSIPNYYADSYPGMGSETTRAVQYLSDPVNHRLFEYMDYQSFGCDSGTFAGGTSIVSYDTET